MENRMKDRQEFLGKLAGLLELAKENGEHITGEEVENYFGTENLTKKHMELVFDYLLSQKVVVKGYLKINEEISEDEEKIVYSEEEQDYLEEYLGELEMVKDATEGEKEALLGQVVNGDEAAKQRLIEIYLKEVVEIAKDMYHPEVFLGDLVQEGNVGLILGIDLIENVENAHEVITTEIKQSIQALIEEQTELKNRDQKMVEKVNELDEAITTLTEELGRKVTLEELSLYTGMTEEEVEDVLKLTGEDAGENTKEEEA